MNHGALTIEEDRPLTASERTLVRWLLENGGESAQTFLPQIGQLRVIGRCACGCASVDFAVGGQAVRDADESMKVLSDYNWVDDEERFFGVYIFARRGVLAGLDLWSIDGAAIPNALPEIERLRPVEPRGVDV